MAANDGGRMGGASGQSVTLWKAKEKSSRVGPQPSPEHFLISSDDRVPVTQGPPTRSHLFKVPFTGLWGNNQITSKLQHPFPGKAFKDFHKPL